MREISKNFDGVKKEWIAEYWQSLTKHIAAVKEAGEKLGVPKEQLDMHDDSKWSDEEFPYYAQQFHGDAGDPDGFARAWLHHIHENAHHPEFWMFPGGFAIKGSSLDKGKIEIPENYALEMVADWMGSSFVYTGSWDMSAWLTKRLWLIPMHRNTRAFVRKTLQDLWYEFHGKEVRLVEPVTLEG